MKMFKTFLAFTFVIALNYSYSQASNESNEWQKFHTEQGFEFYIKYADCKFYDVQDQSWALIKVVNTNDFDAEINFWYDKYLDGKCNGCGNYDEENKKVVPLQKNTSREGRCKPDSRRGPLEVFHKFTLLKQEGRELTDLKIKNLTVIKKKIK